jgi:hypothetical protein
MVVFTLQRDGLRGDYLKIGIHASRMEVHRELERFLR